MLVPPVHWLFWHVIPLPQAWPHEPQLDMSEVVSTQELLQHDRPVQPWPQLPQLFGSLVVSTHVVPQHVLALPRHVPQPPPEST